MKCDAPTVPADVEDDLLLQIRPLLEMSKPELPKEWTVAIVNQ